MTKTPSKQFKKHNFHDSTLEEMEIKSSLSYGREKAQIILNLSDPEGKKIKLTFKDCKNISLSADFDLLRDNSGAGNTSHTGVITKPKKIIKLIKDIEQSSNIEYLNMESPVDKKIVKIKEFTCFKLYFFGGTLKIVAKDFEMK